MKKLLVVLMVLSMASIANAAVVINVDMGAKTELAVGDTATISIVATDEKSPSNLYLFVTEGSLGTVSGGSVVFSSTAGEMSLHQGAADLYIEALHQYGWPYGGWPDAAQTYYISLTGNTNSSVINGTVVDSITYRAEIAGDSTIILGGIVDDGQGDGGYLMAVWDTVVITQVPEPMTMTLLALGGLLLRRRR